MFYCDPCREDRKWPKGLNLSKQVCECCSQPAICHHMPMNQLPTKEPTEMDLLKALARSVSYPYRDVFSTAAWAVKRINELEQRVADLIAAQQHRPMRTGPDDL